MEGAIVTHNQPAGSANEYSFSKYDIKFFVQEKLAILRGVDEKFVYELNRSFNQNKQLVNESPTLYEAINDEYLLQHKRVMNITRRLKIGYERRNQKGKG